MEVFLFPLVNVTLFPKTTKPLNIFEQRYLSMVKDSIQKNIPIAIGFIEDASQVVPVKVGEKVPFVRDVAGFGMPQIVEERLNGTLLVFLQGKGKVRLGKVKENNGAYIICEAEEVIEDYEVKPEAAAHLQALHRVLIRWIHQHITEPTQRDMFLANIQSPAEIIGAFSAYMIRDYDLQQMVLEYDNINDKISYLFRLTQSNELTT